MKRRGRDEEEEVEEWRLGRGGGVDEEGMRRGGDEEEEVDMTRG